MAAVFSRLPMRVRCATQRDHIFHPEMNYSQTQLDQLDRLTEGWVADHLQKGKTSKKDKELVTLEEQGLAEQLGQASSCPLAGAISTRRFHGHGAEN
jgi:hypothetical protein